MLQGLRQLKGSGVNLLIGTDLEQKVRELNRIAEMCRENALVP